MICLVWLRVSNESAATVSANLKIAAKEPAREFEMIERATEARAHLSLECCQSPEAGLSSSCVA